MKQCYAVILLLFILSWEGGHELNAQKVALVLSGGGAKGVCHIGVLKALEDACVPIDYIAGTSMGAIIGGLYASGYSPAEMERIITSAEFNEWVSGKIDSKYVYYFRQPYPDASWMTFKFLLDSVLQPQLPTNLISPSRMDFAFMELFASASAAANNNFDSLMVPFRCVAADVENNRSVVLRSGDLGSSIRASMTFPFYFKPIRLNGRLLFDGGMYNNFPSDVAYNDFYPDIIVGSKAASNAPPPAEGNVISQLTNMLMEKSEFDVLCESGVLIEPRLDIVNVIDFSQTLRFIDSGYVAAVRMIPEIRKFVLDSVTPEQRKEMRRKFNDRKPAYHIKNYNITGLASGQYEYIRKLMEKDPPGRSHSRLESSYITLEDVKEEYFRFLAEEKVSHAYPTLAYSRDMQGYVLHIQANRENNLNAAFGGNISSKANNNVFLQLQYNYWSKFAALLTLNGYMGRFYSSVKAGGRVEFPSRIPFFFELNYFVSQFNYKNTTNVFFFDSETPVYLKHLENFTDARIGFPVRKHNKVEIGFSGGRNRDSYYQTNAFTSKDTLDHTFNDFFSPFLLYESSSLNRKQYANAGTRFYSQVRFVQTKEKHSPGSTGYDTIPSARQHEYLRLNLVYERFFRKRGIYTGGVFSEMMISFQPLSTNYTSSLMAAPGFAPIPEMTTVFQPTFRNHVYFAIGQRNILTLWKNLDFRVEGYMVAPFRELQRKNEYFTRLGPQFKSLNYVVSASLVYQSPIGPLSISQSWYGKEERPYSFFINVGYVLFNRESLR